jgi:hypothetical protein
LFRYEGCLGVDLRGARTISILIVLLGCAHEAPPPAVAFARLDASEPRVRLGVLPPDDLSFSDIATALGEPLRRVTMGTTGPSRTEVVMAKVSMEVAQLSLECVTPTNDCYAAVGKFLQVDRLLWSQLSRDQDKTRVKVTVVLFDVGLGTGIGRAERTFPEHGAATEGLQKVVDEAMAGAHGQASAHSSVLSKADGPQ